MARSLKKPPFIHYKLAQRVEEVRHQDLVSCQHGYA